jgi:Rod binding domain-containing protein
MADTTAISSAQNSLLNAQAAQLIKRTQAANSRPGVKPDNPDNKDDAKIDKSARDFESILLSGWLQGAEQSFAQVPGGDGEDDDDPGKDQFQGIAMQALGSAMTADGGIGIAKMIAQHLREASAKQTAASGKSS